MSRQAQFAWVVNRKTGGVVKCRVEPDGGEGTRGFYLFGVRLSRVVEAAGQTKAPEACERWVPFGRADLESWGLTPERFALVARDRFSESDGIVLAEVYDMLERATCNKPPGLRFYYAADELWCLNQETGRWSAGPTSAIVRAIGKFQKRLMAEGARFPLEESIARGKRGETLIPWRISAMFIEGKSEDEIMKAFCREGEGRAGDYLPPNIAEIVNDYNGDDEKRGLSMRGVSRKYGISMADLHIYFKRAEKAGFILGYMREWWDKDVA